MMTCIEIRKMFESIIQLSILLNVTPSPRLDIRPMPTLLALFVAVSRGCPAALLFLEALGPDRPASTEQWSSRPQ
jgi:hypothetical protein